MIVHNGIIENYRALRQELEEAGRTIESETDTELIAHLIDQRRRRRARTCSPRSARRAPASTAPTPSARSARSYPDHIVAAKNGGSPMIFGLGEKQTFLASDIPAILPYTRQMLFLEDGEFAVLSEDGVQIVDADGRPLERESQADPVGSGLGGEGRLRPLHAEGDLRAAARHHRHHRHARAGRRR